MSAPGPAELARRLFRSVQRERPGAALRERVIRAGRAELARGGGARIELGQGLGGSLRDAQSGAERAPDSHVSAQRSRVQRVWPRRSVAVGALAAAAGVVLYLGLAGAPDRGVLISAERTTGASSARETSQPAVREVASSEVASSERAAQGPAPGVRAETHTDATASTPAITSPRVAAPRVASPSVSAPTAASSSPSPSAARPAPPTPSTPAAATSAESTTSQPTPPAPAAPRPTLGQQLEQLKEARAALRAGEHQRALRLLDAYRAQPGSADMAAEADLLRIEALAASGQRDAAAEAARQFVSDYPNSPLIDRALSYASSGSER